MMNEYIQAEQFTLLLTDIQQKIEQGKINECSKMLIEMLADAKTQDSYIDRTYIGSLNERKHSTTIREIDRMLAKMSLVQVENVRKYAADEFDEPNHEAEALEAIINLSRRKNMKKEEQPDAE